MCEQIFGEVSNYLLWMTPRLQAPQCGGTLSAPVGKKRIHGLDEGDELRVLENGGLDGLLG